MTRATIVFMLTLLLQTTCHADPSQLFTQINPDSMWRDLKTLTQFPDRAASTKNGIAAADWLKQQIEHMMRQSKRHDIHLYTIDTHGFPQPSILLKIGNTNNAGVVIGAHFDTVDCDKHACSGHGAHKRPGADDDGSGTVTVLEIARILLNSNTYFRNPIYLAWYAAEENDLDGSRSVVNYFRYHKIPVSAVMQLDMTGDPKNIKQTMWLSDTGHYHHVNASLTKLALQLAKKYINNDIAISHLDDESDHWSWQEAGYKTVYPVESNCHGEKLKCPYREHTAKDTMDQLSLAHMVNYLKLALAFTNELAKPI